MAKGLACLVVLFIAVLVDIEAFNYARGGAFFKSSFVGQFLFVVTLAEANYALGLAFIKILRSEL